MSRRQIAALVGNKPFVVYDKVCRCYWSAKGFTTKKSAAQRFTWPLSEPEWNAYKNGCQIEMCDKDVDNIN